jgi:hypothetical protein
MMKTTLLTILILYSASVVSAQSIVASTDAPVAVLKHSWTKERINWEGDPFAGPVENFDEVRRRRVDERRIERARGTGNVGEAAKVEREMRAEQVIKARPPAPPRYVFLYKVSIKNNSDKTIKSIDWDYVFLSANTQSEAGRLEFTSDEKIAPGKNKEINVMARKPPAKTISVYALDKRESQGLDGQIVIMRVEYTDGTVWQRPQ